MVVLHPAKLCKAMSERSSSAVPAAGGRGRENGRHRATTPGPGFTGITKQRYADFIVHEVSLSVHGAAELSDGASPPQPAAGRRLDDAPRRQRR